MVLCASRAGVAKWQTQQTQNLPPSRACGFKSLLRHHLKPFIGKGLSFDHSHRPLISCYHITHHFRSFPSLNSHKTATLLLAARIANPSGIEYSCLRRPDWHLSLLWLNVWLYNIQPDNYPLALPSPLRPLTRVSAVVRFLDDGGRSFGHHCSASFSPPLHTIRNSTTNQPRDGTKEKATSGIMKFLDPADAHGPILQEGIGFLVGFVRHKLKARKPISGDGPKCLFLKFHR